MDTLIAEVHEIRNNTVASNSRTIYLNSITRFVLWISVNKPQLLHPDFIHAVQSIEGSRKQVIRQVLLQKNIQPIIFNEIQAPDFMSWLVSLRTNQGSRPGYSTYNSHRSALFNLFRDYGQTMSQELASELSNYFKGLKRTTTMAIARGEASVKVGKDPLPFSLYKLICLNLLKESKKEYIFGHCFMIICWNLMCRSANAINIKYEHLQWVEDALCVYFSHQKNDPTGERPKDPRHVYPNPLFPEICPILALGLYWLTFSFTNNNSLFPGQNQYDRFRKILNRASSQVPAIAEELQRLGIDSQDLGTHSMRKGSATYCSSGNTAGPTSSAIHLRAGWAMGGVQDTYLRYEAAGDMYVGRVASGLPVNQPEFDAVGPRFLNTADLNITQYVRDVFAFIPDSMLNIGENALASLIYHYEFIRNTFHSSHPVRQSILFRDRGLFETLKPHVVCSLEKDFDHVATGIPPHTSLLRNMTSMVNAIQKVIPAIDAAKNQIVDGVVQVLEDRAIGAGTVTRDGLQQLLSSELERYLGTSHLSSERVLEENGNENQQNSTQPQLYFWGGRFRRLPESYTLPNGTVLAAFRAWMLPDTETNVSALRYCSCNDFNNTNSRKRFSDLSVLMKKIQGDRQISNPTNQQLNEMVRQWAENCPIDLRTPKGRERRIGQLKWTSVLNMIRKNEMTFNET